MKFKYYPLIILCLIFLGKVSTVSAQKIHFSDTSNKWMTYFYHSQGASNGQQVYYKYSYSDSVVVENGHTYSVLNKGTNGLMLVREEGNKVYIKPLVGDFCGLIVTDPNEFLYFDYDLQIGDTLKMPLITTMTPNAYSIHRVESMDSTIINGTWHKMLHMKVVSGFTGEYIVTEGLGASQGPLVAGYSLNYAGPLICFQNNGTTPLPNLNNCTKLNAVDEPDVIAGFFQIIPNPASGNILIHYTGQSRIGFQLDIVDVLGRNIKHTQFAQEIKIDVSDFSSGMFFFSISDENGLKNTKKIIIKH